MSQFPPQNNPYQATNQPPTQPPPESADLSVVDWVLIVLCSGIACIIGIIRLIQGKPNAGKMIGFSLLFVVIWNVISFAIRMAIGVQ